jgi:hypothetical protein
MRDSLSILDTPLMSTRKHVLLSLLAAGAVAGIILQHHFAAPVPVAARDLFLNRDAWTGKKVEVVGELKEFLSGTADAHSAIEEDGFRVGVRGDARPEPRALFGRRVRARGVFVFTEKTGGYLESPALGPAP